MIREPNKRGARAKRHARVRARLMGTAERPRLSLFRSLRYVYVQAVDDQSGRTVATASSLEFRKQGGRLAKTEAAKRVGTLIAERLVEKGHKTAVFDRGGNLYHGRVKAVADAARAAGLKF
jgi:large subunit ribosomal protein L18